MESLPKKRRLAEITGNISSPKCQSFTKPSEIPVENAARIFHSFRDSRSPNVVEKTNYKCCHEEKCPGNLRIPVVLPINDIKNEEEIPTKKPTVENEGNAITTVYSISEDDFLWFSIDYLEDIISYEMYKESQYQLSSNFCKKFDINPTGREILIDWLICVQVHLNSSNANLHLSVALLDIMLDKVYIPVHELQAASLAAFWVAHKFLHGNLSMKTLLGLCAGSVTKAMIEEAEILVLQTSKLIQAGGSLTVFISYILYKIFGFKFPPEIYYCCLYLAEIMLLQFTFVTCSAYEKAAAVAFTSMSVFGISDRFVDDSVSKFITKNKLEFIYRRLISSIGIMYSDKDSLKKSSVFRKYKTARYYKISTHQNLKNLHNITVSV